MTDPINILAHQQLTALAVGMADDGREVPCTVQTAAQACAAALGGEWSPYADRLLAGGSIDTGMTVYQGVDRGRAPLPLSAR